MGFLWGNDKKKCPDCGMDIPSSAKVCPYCHKAFGSNSLADDIHEFGCLGYPLMLILILAVFWLLGKCS